MNRSAVLTTAKLTFMYGSQQLEDIPAEKMADADSGMNPPAWIVVHLVSSLDMAGQMLGQAPVGEADWGTRFDMSAPRSNDLAWIPMARERLTDLQRKASF